MTTENHEELRRNIESGGAEKYHEKNKEKGKMFVRDRLKELLDDDLDVEDAFFANCMDGSLPADGVVTGIGKVNGQRVCIMANDSTVKAGSWGKRTVEKILRIQETAMKLELPMLYLVDSAGARITDQIDMFPNRRGAGRIFYNQVKLFLEECHRFVYYSVHLLQAAPTYRRFAMLLLWLMAMLPCISVHQEWQKRSLVKK